MNLRSSAAARPQLGDLWGGLAAAAVVLPQAMAFGVALLVPAGLPAAQGALVGLLGAAVLSTLTGLIGRANGLISSPTGPALVLLGGSAAAISAAGAPLLPALAAMTVLAGIMQIAIGAAGGGALVKLIPYPVVAGFMTGSALLMLVSQAGPVSGRGATEAWAAWRWLPALTAFATLALVHYGPRLVPAVPGVITGLTGGTALFHAGAAFGPGTPPPQWLIGALPSVAGLDPAMNAAALEALPWATVASGAVALALLAALNTLLVAIISDAATESRHHSMRELLAQGVALVGTGLAGGMAGSATTGATLVALRAGGRRWAALVAGVVLTALVAGGGAIGRLLPIAVLAGIIIAVAVRMIERDVPAWLRRRGTRMDGAITLVVTFVTVAYDLVTAIAVGVAIAVVSFLYAQVRSPVVHRRSTGANVRSVRARGGSERELLERHGDRIVVYELRGSLFFATADRLYEELMRDLSRPVWMILHLRRVSHVDLTALKILQQMAVQLARHGGELAFCNVHEGIGLGHRVEDALARVGSGSGLPVRTFNGLDEALEHAEDALLTELGAPPSPPTARVELQHCEICRGMQDEAIEALAGVLATRTEPAGSRVFRVGDHGDELYVLIAGEVDILLPTTAHHHKRLAKCGPGSFFGELAFVHPGPRAADAVAVTGVELRVLDRAAFERLADRHPRAAIAVLMALGAAQVAHQRWSTAEIRRLSEW